MKILHIVSGDSRGGAALGASALHDALCQAGFDSTIIFDKLVSPRDTYLELDWVSRIKLVTNKIVAKALSYVVRNSFDLLSLPIGLQVHKRVISVQKPDIVHIHWISRSGSLAQYQGNFKTVITARDMWWATGGCHYSLDCQKYIESCDKCPRFARPHNLNHYKLEKKYFVNNVNIFSISKWLTNELTSAGLRNVAYIPNSVYFNRQIEMPENAVISRRFIFIPSGNLASKYKGLERLYQIIKDNPESNFVFAGAGRLPVSLADLRNVKTLTFLTRPQLNWFYKNASLVLIPSVQEAFGKTVVEALMLTSKVVTSRDTAPFEIIQHSARLGSKIVALEDLLQGRLTLGEASESLRTASYNLDCFTPERVADNYIKAYLECS